MAADVPVKPEVCNSCCAVWKKKCLKIGEARNHLRQAVKILQERSEEVEAQNSNLKKEYEELRVLADIEKEEKVKESAARVSLENNISVLKSEILSLKQRESADSQDENEVKLLKGQVSEGEQEINRLKELIEIEKKRAESERKKAEVEKKKAAEARKSMKIEKSKADEERKRANIEGEKAENYRLQLEVLEKEADKAKSNLASETLKLEVAIKTLGAEKKKVVKERECTKSEMAKAEEQRKLAEADRKKTIEEKCHAESLSLQLLESRNRVDELQKEINEIRCSTELHVHPGGPSDNNRNAVASKEISNFEKANKRYEVEKQKAIKEKRRADSEMVKTQKQKKLAEVNWKKAMEEKSRADNLSQQLDEAKKKIEELSTRNLIEVSAVQLAKGMGAETAKVKLLKKQLKFEKMQRKHAKEVVKVKLERSRNSILQQELGRLKLDFDQFSQRLDMLNKSFSYSAEGIDDCEKTWNIMKKQQLDIKNYEGLESLQMNRQSGIDLLKPGFPVLDASDPFREAMQHAGPYPPLSGGNCTGSISGIDSQLESPRGFERKMLQSSAINSSTASFSDGQLVGSQEKVAFSVTVPAKLVEENVQPTISNLSAEVTKRKCNETFAVVAENSVRSPARTNGITKGDGHSRKRKRIIDVVESIENLYCEGKKFHEQVEEKLSDLHFLLNKETKKPFEERLHEERKVACEGKLVLQNCADSNEQKKADRLENDIYGCANVCRQVSKTADVLTGTGQATGDGISDLDNNDMVSFDEVTDGNYLKLLELDNAADEECYRMAMEMPLSPTLLEIEVQDVEAADADKINPLIKETIGDRLSNKNGGHGDSFDIQGLNGNGSDNYVAMGKSWDRRVQDAGAEVLSNAPISRSKAMFPFGIGLGCAADNGYYVVFSNTEDSSCISRICNASRTCIAQCSLAIHTEWMVHEILFALKTEEKLLPKEKVCVFFSLLLLNFSIASSKFGSLNWDSNPCLDSFVRHMCSVMSDAEGRRIFSEFGCLDESLSLIEDFLIHGRVFVCNDASSKMVECHSRNNLLDDMHISPRPASADELVAGSIVLASLCAALDHIGFICETSYNFLQIRRLNRSLVLTILHVFAYLGGEKFFNFSNYNLVTVMKSIVTFLEGDRLSDSAGSCIPSVSNSGNEICPCVRCPFSEDAVSVDTATSLLLESLQNNALLGPVSRDELECNSNSNPNLTVCNLSDILSLVELVAFNTSWAWASVKVVPQLLKILESCKFENVNAGIVVLLGQLGRLGVNSVGYDDKGVEFLRHELSAFLCCGSATSAGLPTQIATVTSLLGLISFDFKTIVQSNVNPPAMASQSDLAQSIRKWFSLLPKKQQDLSFGLLQTASVDKM